MESVERVAEAVLYEGYLLYPYTRSTTKNQQRWTFGGVYPKGYSETSGGDDPWLMQTECLVLGNELAAIEVKLRFLHVVDRTVLGADGEILGELRAGDLVYRPWEESVERQLVADPLPVGQLAHWPRQVPIAIEAGSSREPLMDSAGRAMGALVRSWRALEGTVEIAASAVQEGCWRVRVTVTNLLPWPPTGLPFPARADVVRQSLISTHTILRVAGGEFISLLEPPEPFEDAARECRNIKTWPVLAGSMGERQIVLSSPIILYDYPQVAPESPGNLFDATEIDELLTLSVLTLTDDEKREMRESDPRGREILERTEALTPGEILKMHGVIRSMRIRSEEA